MIDASTTSFFVCGDFALGFFFCRLQKFWRFFPRKLPNCSCHISQRVFFLSWPQRPLKKWIFRKSVPPKAKQKKASFGSLISSIFLFSPEKPQILQQQKITSAVYWQRRRTTKKWSHAKKKIFLAKQSTQREREKNVLCIHEAFKALQLIISHMQATVGLLYYIAKKTLSPSSYLDVVGLTAWPMGETTLLPLLLLPLLRKSAKVAPRCIELLLLLFSGLGWNSICCCCCCCWCLDAWCPGARCPGVWPGVWPGGGAGRRRGLTGAATCCCCCW